MSRIPLHPKHPERTCWGCDKYCPAESLACGNGTERTQHPMEIFGDDWLEWAEERQSEPALYENSSSELHVLEPLTTISCRNLEPR